MAPYYQNNDLLESYTNIHSLTILILKVPLQPAINAPKICGSHHDAPFCFDDKMGISFPVYKLSPKAYNTVYHYTAMYSRAELYCSAYTNVQCKELNSIIHVVTFLVGLIHFAL